MTADVTNETNAPVHRFDGAAFAVFTGLVANASTAFSIQAWMTYGFGARVWHMPEPLAIALIVALDLFAVLFMILTYLLRGTGWPRAVVTVSFLFAVGVQVFAAELFGAHEGWPTSVRWFSALPAVFLALAQEGVILWRMHGTQMPARAAVRGEGPRRAPREPVSIPVLAPSPEPEPAPEVAPTVEEPVTATAEHSRLNGAVSRRQVAAARRVIDGGEDTGKIAAEYRCSVRAVQIWVKAERKRRADGQGGGPAAFHAPLHTVSNGASVKSFTGGPVATDAPVPKENAP